MIIKKFEEIVGRYPGKAAIKTGSKSLTYAELNFNANRVAHAIAGKDKEAGTGVEKQQVALLFDYGSDMLVGLLGALKANKTYVPLDFSYPGKRLLYILENSETYLILTDNRNHEFACELSGHAGKKINVLNINTIGDEIPGTAIDREASEERTAYILYTSGSTGKPKGVFQIHRHVLYYTRNWVKRFSITESDRMSLLTSFTHDGAVQDIFSALLSGACLYPYSVKETGSVEELYMLLVKEKLTIWHSTPSLFRYFAGILTGEDHFSDVRWILLGGEPLRAHDLELYKTYFSDACLVNVYGQTESSVSSLCVIDPQNTFDDVSLGEPLDETNIFLMDEDGDMVEEMGGGEIVVACDYITPGYWQDKENSEKVFLHDEHRGRLYRTGDMGRFTARGSIKMMGRKDFQVKIRGFRIELGEIETGLLQHYAVKEAIVIARPDENKDNYLCAYIVSSQLISSEDLREYLFEELPDYMVPRHFIFMEKMPVNSSGKIDRLRLPEPGKIIDSRSAYIAPATEIEKKIAAIWQEVLKVEKIGVNDNFTELGGHSLLIMSIIAKIHRDINVELKLTDVFGNPTIKELSLLVMKSKQTIFSAIEPVEERKYYLLSSSQKRLYILQQMNPNSTAYNMPEIIPLPAGSDWEKIEGTFKRMIKRHESLRTSFHMVNDGPVQKIHHDVGFEIEYYNLSTDQKSEPPGASIKKLIRPFDLSQPPLLRVVLLKNADESHLLLVDMHHIISDGVSHVILVKDYQALLYESKELPQLRLQYKDFSVWQNNEREKETLKRQEEYWLKEFAGEIPVLNIPTDYLRPVEQSFEGDSVNFEISTEETRALNAVALQGGATLFMVLVAVFNILLSKLSGQEEIIIGTPIAGRRHTDLEKIIGMFVNTLSLRNYPAGNRTFRELLGDVKERLLTVFENQEYPFEELVDKLSVNRDIGRNPLFDIMFILQNMDTGSADQDQEPEFETGRPVQPDFPQEYENIVQTAKFDLTLSAMERGRGLFLSFQYCTKLFKKETVERFIDYFKKIVSIAVNEPGIRLSEIEIIREEEKSRLLFDFNDTEADYPKDKTLHRLFEEQVERSPDRIALVGAAPDDFPTISVQPARTVCLTYRELNDRSDRLAYLLIGKGVLADNIIGIMMERCMEMVVGIMGILKSGGAYLPIGADYPQERIDFMLKDSSAKILLTDNEIVSLSTECVITPEAFLNPSEGRPFTSPHSSFITHHSSNLAYIIYTSGSTGKPKGVVIKHRSMINFIKGVTDIIPFTANDRILSLTTISFDIFGLETLVPLVSGSVVVMGGREEQLNPEAAGIVIERESISIFQVTPSRLRMIIDIPGAALSLKTVNFLLVGGEVFSKLLLEKIKPLVKGRIFNMYGPTETTIWSTIKELSAGEALNIGKPIANTRIYIVDNPGKLQPVEIGGELCIGGDGLARGYLNNPGLTAEKFVISHLSLAIGSSLKINDRLYKTGDLARLLSDGNIEFLGRLDHQVKIRGFRVELGEIESRILNYPGIKEVVVLFREEESGDKYICAYIVSAREYGISELRESLAKELPDYMLPSYFVRLEKIPLTPNRKIDRKALPKPEIKAEQDYVAPRNRTEAKLVGLWADVLNIQPDIISLDKSFFQLGGHSLKATALVFRIHKEFNIKVPLTKIFETPTIRGLSQYIKDAKEETIASIEPVEKKRYYALSPAQKRLFILHRMDLNSVSYNLPQVISFSELIDVERMQSGFKELIMRHESLRTSFAMVGEEPVQWIHEEVNIAVEVYEANEVEAEEITGRFTRPFDLSRAPLLRAGIIKLKSPGCILLTDMHHIITDAASNAILSNEFNLLYSGNGEDLPLLRLQYKDYARWQNSEIQQALIKEQETYWLKMFPDEVPVLNLPTDYPRAFVQSFEGCTVGFLLSEKENQALNLLAKEAGTTLYMSILSVFTILLSKLSGQVDIVVGTPVAARRHEDLEKIIGMFVNTLALGNNVSGGKSVKEFVKETKARTLNAFENQEYQFENLVDKIKVVRDTGRNPVFDVMFNLLSREEYEGDIPGIGQQGTYTHRKGTSKFDLTLTAVDLGKWVHFSIEYCTKLFKPTTIERFISYFKKILSGLSENSDQKLSQLEIITETEKQQILYEFNDTKAEYRQDITLHELFEEQVEKTPDSIAISGPLIKAIHESRLQISYRELNKKSNRLARRLRERGVTVDTIVGLLDGGSLEMIVGLLGVLKAGGAYLPMDPESPGERIALVLKSSDVELLLMRHGVFARENVEFTGEILYLDDESLNSGSAANVENLNHPGDLAYLIYTSGSTGKPKGIMVEHRGVVNYIKWAEAFYLNGEKCDFPLYSSPAFDLTVTSIYVPLVSGNSIVIYARDANEFVISKIIREGVVQVLKLTPTHLGMLKYGSTVWRGIRRLIVGGENLTTELAGETYQFFNEDVEIYNEYGPTEAVVGCMIHKYEPISDRGKSVPIGTPIANVKIYILAGNRSPVPGGAAGELCISGEGLARGYLNRPGLTAEKFVAHPWIPGKSMYRTGDRARWLPDGKIEFLGRKDDQVKIRGNRVETGEIEYRLRKHGAVKEVVVVVLEPSAEIENRSLCVYFVSDRELEIEEMRDYLSGTLPNYMIPSYFVRIERIPLTASGKVNRKALPEPGVKPRKAYESPINEIEEMLTSIWLEVLRIEKIGVNDSFFEMGGDSIKAILVVSRLAKHKMKFDLRDLFLNPTIRQLAKCIKKTVYEADQRTAAGEVPLTPVQHWFFQSHRGDRHHFNQSIALHSRDGFCEETVRKVFTKIVEHHDALRMRYRFDGSRIIQENRGLDGELFHLEVSRLEAPAAAASEIERQAGSIQASFDLNRGPLVKLGLFKTPAGDYLAIIIHHLVIDGVSWRILLEDFSTLYRQVRDGREMDLPLKTTSFKEWGEKLEAYSLTGSLSLEISYWRKVEQTKVPPQPKDRVTAASHQRKDSKRLTFQLSPQHTEKLLKEVNKAYNTKINDILLTGLGLALKDWTGRDRSAIHLEGHGRENAVENVDLSRTIGWFTAIFPVIIEVKDSEGIQAAIKDTKEMLRRIPNRGTGYGILKYMTPEEKKQDMVFSLKPGISFNYLGQFDEVTGPAGGLFRSANIPVGTPVSPNLERLYGLDIIGIVLDGTLAMSVDYDSKAYNKESISRFMGLYEKRLQEIILHCTGKEKNEWTASDLTSTDIHEKEIGAIFDELGEAFNN